MHIPIGVRDTWTGLGALGDSVGSSFSTIAGRQALGNGTGSLNDLRTQWANPVDISTILMVIGGDVVQKAFAQGTGKIYTPVCFSFGCVAYAFIVLMNIIGDGRLLPSPDCPAKVFNLDSGYARENKNFVVGRILRDIELHMARKEPLGDDGIRITVFEAKWNRNPLAGFSWSRIHMWGIFFTAIQFVLASGPIIIGDDWTIMLITATATLLIQITGWLPQWRAEKLPNRQRSSGCFALTAGNGARDIVVIIGYGNCLDLEELSASASPRHGRPWEKFQWFSMPRVAANGNDTLPRRNTQLRKTRNAVGLPIGFWITRCVCAMQSVLWLLLLINVSAPKDYSWFLLAIGGIGMFQNVWLAAMEQPPRRRNLPLRLVETIRTRKVMDGLMDFHFTYQRGVALRQEFFPGSLRPKEKEWWRGDYDGYDAEREHKKGRGIPRSRQPELPKFRASNTSGPPGLDSQHDDDFDPVLDIAPSNPQDDLFADRLEMYSAAVDRTVIPTQSHSFRQIEKLPSTDIVSDRDNMAIPTSSAAQVDTEPALGSRQFSPVDEKTRSHENLELTRLSSTGSISGSSSGTSLRRENTQDGKVLEALRCYARNSGWVI